MPSTVAPLRYRGRMAGHRSVDFSEARFTSPICTVREAAELVGMPVATLQSWAGQRRSRPQVVAHIQPHRRGWPSVPLVGVVEAATLRALALNLKPSEIAAVATWMREQYSDPHPFANRRLMSDGAFAYVEEDSELLYRVRTSQHVIRESIATQLRPVEFADDNYPLAFRVDRLPGVLIDPRFNAGRMAFARNRVPVFAVVGSLQAGEPADEVADSYRLTRDEVAQVEQHLEWLATAA